MSKIEIEHIQLAANPVNTKTAIKISMDVTDKEITYTNDIKYAGELYGNQQIGVI